MISLTFNLGAFEQRAKELGASIDQVPFALSGALNDAAKGARQILITHTWPGHVTVRNKNFIGAALRTEFANKRSLKVAIYDSLQRGSLALHAKGGTKQARGRLAVPTARVTRGSSGVVKSQRPQALKRSVLKGNLLFQAVGRGKNSKLQLMFKLQPTARIKADVPFEADFRSAMADGVRTAFGPAMAKAMATRR